MRVPTDEKYQRDVPCDTCDGIGWVFSREINVDGKPATMRCQDCRQAREAAAIRALHEEKADWVRRFDAARDTADRLDLTAVKAAMWAHDRDGDGDYECEACSCFCHEEQDWVAWPCPPALALIEAMEAITRMESA